MPRSYPSARERILDGAERVILRDGLGRFSVDAVLVEAKISKGGFFHHFATKDALLCAITERLTAHVGELVEQGANADPEPHGRLLRAQIELVFGMPRAEGERMRALVLALIEAARSNPALRDQIRAANRRALAEEMAQGVGVGQVLLIQLALDGYWIGESLGTLPFSKAQRAQLRAALLEQTRPRRARRKPGGSTR